MSTKYQHLFFDLDRTLYDFDSNNRQTLLDLFNEYLAEDRIVDCFDTFFNTYSTINTLLWQQYRNKEITKDYLNSTRFRQTLNSFSVHNGLADIFAREYILRSPLQTKVISGTFEILEYLYPKYKLHIITNGFEEIQYLKMRSCGIDKYFTSIITSEKAGALKPSTVIFQHAMNIAGACKKQSLIIGDDPETDIKGGLNFGMDQVWIHSPGEISDITPTFKINTLEELKKIL